MDHAWDLGIGSSLLRFQESTMCRICLLFNCRLFSVGCMHFPHVQYTIPISQYWRDLVELEDFGIAHLSNQILWFLTEMVDLLRLLKVFQQHIPLWVIFKLFNWSSDCFFFDLFPPVQQWTVECLGFENQHDYCHKSPCAFGFTQICDKYILLSVSSSAQVLREVTWVNGTLCSRVFHQFSCIPLFLQKNAGCVLESVIACDRVW